MAGSAMAGADLQASDVPGIQHERFLAGARIERIDGFAPLPRCAAMIATASHGPTLCVGADPDATSFTDPGLVGDCLVAGLDEVLALGGAARAVAVR
jgi:diacylglycerol O-acyltransferase / wax synthase